MNTPNKSGWKQVESQLASVHNNVSLEMWQSCLLHKESEASRGPIEDAPLSHSQTTSEQTSYHRIQSVPPEKKKQSLWAERALMCHASTMSCKKSRIKLLKESTDWVRGLPLFNPIHPIVSAGDYVS